MRNISTCACFLAISATACAVEETTSTIESEIDGTYPSWVTTSSTDDFANRCAVDPAGDINILPQNPSYVLSYWSGKTAYGAYAPWHGSSSLIHRQSIQRMFRGNTNYLVVDGSLSSGAVGVEVIQLPTRGPTTGHLFSGGVTPTTSPNTGDHIVTYLQNYYDGYETVRVHAGGMQTVGRYVIVPFEKLDQTTYLGGFRTLDLANPAAPTGSAFRGRSAGDRYHSGTASMARMSDGKYVAFLFGYDSQDVEVMVSAGTTVPVQSWGWTSKGAWSLAGFPHVQNYQLIPSCDGRLFIVGTYQDGVNDWAALYQIAFNPATYEPYFFFVGSRNLKCSSAYTNNVRYCDFSGGAGAWVDGNGHLVVYGVDYYNDATPGSDQAVRVREF